MASHLRTLLVGTTHVERGALRVEAGVRIAIVLVLLLVPIVHFDAAKVGIPLAIGALFANLAEVGEDPGRRWRTMAWVTLWLMAMATLGSLLSEQAIAVVIASAPVAFACGVAGAAGPRAALGGVLSLVTFIIFAGAPSLPEAAIESGALVGLGGMAATVAIVVSTLVRDPRALVSALGDAPTMGQRFREHLAVRDAFVRHGVRIAVAIPIATAIADASGFLHAYWLPMTIAWVTRPDLEGTVVKVLARVAGTLIGIAISAFLLLALGVHGYAAVLVVAIAGGVTVAFLLANYAVAIVGITTFVIAIFSIGGDPVSEDLILRVGATIAGALLAVAASFIGRVRPAD